jgi:hypothetical protein
MTQQPEFALINIVVKLLYIYIAVQSWLNFIEVLNTLPKILEYIYDLNLSKACHIIWS